jgi:hypothetical protein
MDMPSPRPSADRHAAESAHRRAAEATRARKSRGRPRLLAALAVPAVVAASLLLAACGGSGSDPSSNAAANERSQEQKAETQNADFAKCLREHGVNAETVTGPNGGHGLKIGPGTAGSSPAAMEAAQKACERYRPEAKKINLSPQQKVELEEHVQKFAKCMREHGIKVETNTSGGGVRIGIHHQAGSGEPNPESPGFREAQTACQKLLPKPPGAGKGAPGPFAAKEGPKEGPSSESSPSGPAGS